MRMYDLIEKKKQGCELTKDEIDFIITGYTKGDIPEYQMSAFLMAIYFKGMSIEERHNLTMAMMNSGDVLDLSSIDGIKVDKHSTGGVGDKISLILGPVIASLGLPFAKMSGRGLGHTGGTIDKLEAFPGFESALEDQEFIDQVNDIKMAITGQSKNLAPADKKMYALRDLTATIDEISLITSSVMSKKLASGADAIVLDVTVGDGAFMKTAPKASALAESMVQIGKLAGKKIAAILTNMDEPLGRSVGNQLEVIEAINTLKGNGPADVMEVIYELGAQILDFGDVTCDRKKARELIDESISSGRAFDKFVEFIEAQHGDASYVADVSKFPQAKYVIPVYAKEAGYIHAMKAQAFGLAAMSLGGGREKLDDKIDMSVGLVLNKKVGDQVEAGELLYTMHANDEEKAKAAIENLWNAIEIRPEFCEHQQMILGIVK